MTLDEAIKNLRLMITYWPPQTTNAQFSSILLGIEALQQIKQIRAYAKELYLPLLPGETK